MNETSNCSGGCGGCGSCCGSCGGCAGSLTLTRAELRLLESLGQIPFQPIARRAEDAVPVYLEDDSLPVQTWGLLLQSLEKKGLISLDFDCRLSHFDYSAYSAYPIHGSMALTARGQRVLELVQIQGVGE